MKKVCRNQKSPYICVTKANNMTLQQVKQHMMSDSTNRWNHLSKNIFASSTEMKIDGVMGFIRIENGKAIAVKSNPSKGYYESKSSYADRCDSRQDEISQIDVIARYVNILLNK